MRKSIKHTLGALMVTISSLAMAEPVVLINTFAVDAASEEVALEYWEAARDILEQQPGYISTKLHRSLDDDATYRFINVAQWESEVMFKNAIANMRKELPPIMMKGVSADPNLYRIVRD
ncbi:antibiotic biosynthesis monooxygenase family protein [Vibrio pelagius]|uniref:antibiotic biosynthesis monooxygenase family protein n=1 Tax=Vibrio pelagius TaxID=28169 RepID=UPI003B832DE8